MAPSLAAVVVATDRELLPCQAWVEVWVTVLAPLAVQPVVPGSISPLVIRFWVVEVSMFSRLEALEFWTWKAEVELAANSA